ncbi:uncharacterized protein LOC129911875 [Episyrphus balteatus]|uniref:uncharacterized protein LOC129911875 n=1 Tax=Episyrphus balteatus TaxID=286459 RepID=UPI0024852532|nr:uncharacterized protein LOC129911875 [Episyrphus balteatus]
MSLKVCLFLLLVISVTSYNIEDNQQSEVKTRTKRGAFWDFFQKIAITTNLAVDQYTDTKNTLTDIYDLISDTFSDSKPKQTRTTTTTTPSPDDDGNSTTTEKYRISRYELGRIAGRNFRGLNRLLKIEINDALNQSHSNIAEYQRELKLQFENSVIVAKKSALKGIPLPSRTNMTSTATKTTTKT